MVKNVYIIADNILSPLGSTTNQNFNNVKNGISGVKIHHRPDISEQPLAAAFFGKDDGFVNNGNEHTKFESLLISSIAEALTQTDIKINDLKTGLVIASTKGNISLLETAENNEALQKRISLNASASLIAKHFGFVNRPVVISNACVSGVLAIITGMRLILSGEYEQVIVCGADVISKFIVSGFQSFRALSAERCKPFDKNRTGLNLGEGAATVILSGNIHYRGGVKVAGGGVSNDANHISGPSRTGLELANAIDKAIAAAGISANEIDAISAHGTATVYNDDMEAKALTIAGVANPPVLALKGFYGHTLGAAGLIESILLTKCIETATLLPSLGFEEAGTIQLNINTKLQNKEIGHALKTSSGFGGCNAALVLSK